MKESVRALWLLGATAAMTAMLLASSPFESARRALDRLFAAGPAWAQVQRLLTDASIQETSHGENPLPGLAALRRQWERQPDASKVVFIGNSQMFAVSLAPGEGAPHAEEPSYTDLVAEHYRRERGDAALCYRFAAPGMSYTEALWYVNYLARSPHMRPDVIVLQLNYQSLWNAGIRDGMLGMLDAPEFASAVAGIAQEGQPYSDDFKDALSRYRARKEDAGKPRRSQPEFAGPVIANRLESALRDRLDNAPGWRERPRHKGSLMDLLYTARIYLLRIQPTTARSITGARLRRSQAALRTVLETCAGRGIRVVLFSAPVNPRVSLYRTSADRERYTQFVEELKNYGNTSFYDLESAIPQTCWGTWMNGPDPLHLGRTGHRMMASYMLKALEPAVTGK